MFEFVLPAVPQSNVRITDTAPSTSRLNLIHRHITVFGWSSQRRGLSFGLLRLLNLIAVALGTIRPKP